MRGELQPYPESKESGSPWLGPVPVHWEIRNLRALIRGRNDRNRPDLPLLSVARERGVFVRSDADENHNVIPYDLTNYKFAPAGSLVVNKMKAWQGSMGIAPCDGIVSPSYFVFDLRVAVARFAEALFRSKAYVAHFAQASDGVRVGQWDLSIAGMKDIPVLIPPPDEQATIVRFLDHATAKLDNVIRAKRKVVTLLDEQKRAIIHRAITRGLDPNVPLKNSDIPWLEESPAHWERKRLGSLIELVTGFPFPSARFSRNELDTRLLRGINVTPKGLRWHDATVYWRRVTGDGLELFELVPGDIVLGMDRPTINDGVRAARVEPDDTPALLLQRVARLRSRGDLISDYLLLLLRGKAFRDYMTPIFTGISVPHLSPAQIKSFVIAVPPLHEQEQILTRTSAESASLEECAKAAEQEIRLLREYRTRLITDVVTGKLDVRAAATVLPDVAADGTVPFDGTIDETGEPDDEALEAAA